MKAKKPVWGHIFFYISGSIGPIVSKNNRFTHGWTRTNHVNFMKIGLKRRPVSYILTYNIRSTARSSIHTSKIYLDANTKDMDTKFSRNLKNTSKKTFQQSLLKMTAVCLHTCTKHLELSSINSRIIAMGISLTVFSESRFCCLQAWAHSSSIDHNL